MNNEFWTTPGSMAAERGLVECPYCNGTGSSADPIAMKINQTAHGMDVHRLRVCESRKCHRCRGDTLITVEHKEAMLEGDRLRALRRTRFPTIHSFAERTGLPACVISMVEDGRYFSRDFYHNQRAISHWLSNLN